MNQALVTALQVQRNEKNIIILVPYLTPEDDIISACGEFIEAANASKIARAAAAESAVTQEATDGSNEPN
jgi:hypothetical protein